MKKLTDPKIIKRKISSLTDVIEVTIENFNPANHHLGHLYRIDHVRSIKTPRTTVGRKNVSCVIKKIVGLAIILTKKNEANIKFKNNFIKRYDRRPNQYIIDFESILEMKEKEENDLNNPNEKMKTFVLNAISEPSFSKIENSETFFISFDALQNAEVMIINLNQRAFKHESGIIESLIFDDFEASDPFAYVVSDRYISDEFYEIMIDTEASKYSTAGYGQYFAYKAIHEINIDFIKTEVIYVQFEIESISSIKSINIATSIDRIEFHIVKIDTSFLLCFADLDRLKIYFNNVQNTLVSENKQGDKQVFSMIRRFGHSFFL